MADNDQKILEREEFDVGMTDVQLVAQLELWEKESKDLYTTLEDVRKDNLDYYFGIQTGVDRIGGKESRAVENRVFMATETLIPIATSRLPDINVLSNEEDELYQLHAGDLQNVLNYQMERLGMQEKSELFCRDMLLKRMGVFKVPWNREGNDVDLILVDPKRIKIPKLGRTVRELKFLIEDLELSYSQLELFFGETKAKKLVDKGIVAKISDAVFGTKNVRKATYSVKEVWTNEYVCWFCAGKVIDKKQNPYFNFKDASKNHLDFPTKPYVLKSLFQTSESLVGETDYVQQTKPIQDNINKRKRQIENIAGKVANPNLCIDSSVMSKEEAQNITNQEGSIIYGAGAADPTKVRFAEPGNVPQYLFQDLDTTQMEFDNVWGVHSTTRGEREGRETLGGRKLLKQADLGRIDLVARQIERAMDEVAELWTQQIKLFYDEKRSFAVLGEDGMRFIKDFSNEKVRSVRLIVRPGSTLPKDEVTIHQEALLLWQNKGIGLKTFYKMLRMPNIEAALQDFAETYGGGGQQQPAQLPIGMPGEALGMPPGDVI